MACRLCTHYIDDHYHTTHDNYAATGDVVKFSYITKMKILSRERNSFRTFNLNHHVVRAILHLESLSICRERLIYMKPKGNKKSHFRTYYSFFSVQRNSAPHQYLELFLISLTLGTCTRCTVVILCVYVSATTPAATYVVYTMQTRCH